MNFNIKIREENKKETLKISIIIILLAIIASIITLAFTNQDLVKTIILYLMSIIYIIFGIYVIKKETEKSTFAKQKNLEHIYDPILTRFLIKNEFELDESLLKSEIYYLIKKGYVYFDKEKNALCLRDRNQFKQIDALEKINNEKIKEYSTDEIPSYESMFVGKILFAFHNEIEINELKKNIKDNYYAQRGEICKLAMEKMILYELEKNNMIKETKSIPVVSIACIASIIIAIILFALIGRGNIIFILATIFYIGLNVIIVKNQNLLSYKYTEEIIKYTDDLLQYVETLKRKNLENIDIKNINVENIKIQNEDSEENEEVEKNNDEQSDIQLALLFGLIQ